MGPAGASKSSSKSTSSSRRGRHEQLCNLGAQSRGKPTPTWARPCEASADVISGMCARLRHRKKKARTADLMALLQVRPRRRGRLRHRLCRGFDRSDGHGSIRHRREQLAVIGAQHAARGRCMRGHFGLCTSRRWRSRRHLFLCRTRTERHQRAVKARRRDTSPPRPNAVCRLPSMRLVSKAVRRRARLQRSRGPSPKGLPFPCSSCKAAQASGT